MLGYPAYMRTSYEFTNQTVWLTWPRVQLPRQASVMTCALQNKQAEEAWCTYADCFASVTYPVFESGVAVIVKYSQHVAPVIAFVYACSSSATGRDLACFEIQEQRKY